MKRTAPNKPGSGKSVAIFFLCVAAIAVAFSFFGGTVRRFVRESFLQRVTSTHYELLFPAGALSNETMTQFAAQRETVFAAIDKKLGGAGSNRRIRIIFDHNFSPPQVAASDEQDYSVTGTTIRSKLRPQSPALSAAADAEALLYAAWGKPGNSRIARWTAIWLTGEWRGSELGMAAAEVEQKLGHQRLAIVLSDPRSELPSLDDQNLLGAAWINEVAEFGGVDTVRKLYNTKMARPNVADVTRALGTTPLELDRKWQMWMYAYLAGMPSMPQSSGTPMNMPMAGNH